MMDREIKVGIGDMQFGRGEGTIVTYALGSCIGITFYDPAIRLGALLHILLPERTGDADQNLYKYANTGIQETLRKLTAFGMVKSRTVVKIAGGAKMFELCGKSEFGNIGQRNINMVKQILQAERIHISGEDTGGTIARTMVLDLATGRVSIRGAGKPEKVL